LALERAEEKLTRPACPTRNRTSISVGSGENVISTGRTLDQIVS
jgi:hypothetical protein